MKFCVCTRPSLSTSENRGPMHAHYHHPTRRTGMILDRSTCPAAQRSCTSRSSCSATPPSGARMLTSSTPSAGFIPIASRTLSPTPLSLPRSAPAPGSAWARITRTTRHHTSSCACCNNSTRSLWRPSSSPQARCRRRSGNPGRAGRPLKEYGQQLR